MLDQRALPLLRKNMKQWIMSDPISISLHRVPKIPSGNGGFKQGTPTDISFQSFRLTPFKRRLSNFTSNTQDGDLPVAEYILTCFWDADVERWDTFTHNGDNFIIVAIEPKSDDRQRSDRVVATVMDKTKGLAWQEVLG